MILRNQLLVLCDGNTRKTLQLPWLFEAWIWKELSHTDPEGEISLPGQGATTDLDSDGCRSSCVKVVAFKRKVRMLGKKCKAKQDGKMVKGTAVLSKRWAGVSLCVTRGLGPQGSSFEGAPHSVGAVANSSLTVAGVYPLPSVFILHILLREVPQNKMTWCVIPAPPAEPGGVCGWQCWANCSQRGTGQELGFPREQRTALSAQYQLHFSKGHSKLRIGALVSHDSYT